MLKRNLSIITLLLISSFSSQFVSAAIYKCASSNGKVIYTEKRCSDGTVKENGRWVGVNQHEKLSLEKLINKIKVAEAKSTSSGSSDLTLLNSIMEADAIDAKSLGSSHAQWVLIKDQIELKDAILETVVADIAQSYKEGEINAHVATRFNEELSRLAKKMNEIGSVLLKLSREQARKDRVERERLAAIELKKTKREKFLKKVAAATSRYSSGNSKISHGDAVWIGKKAVKRLLKDPESAEFRNIDYINKDSGGGYICGEVNSKNSFGGYSGWQHFVSSGTKSAYLEEQVSSFRSIWNEFCAGKAW